MLKKEKAMQRSIDELNLKLRDVQNELEASQREYKKLHGEHLGLRKAHEDALEAIEAVRRDLKHAQVSQLHQRGQRSTQFRPKHGNCQKRSQVRPGMTIASGKTKKHQIQTEKS